MSSMKYHLCFAICRVGEETILASSGQLEIYTTMQDAAKNLTILASCNPNTNLTIRELKVMLPWTRSGF